MATNSSIAGRAHGATPATPESNDAEYRPQLTGVEGIHPEVARAVQVLFDNVYALRQQQQKADPKKPDAKAATTATADAGNAAGGAIPNHATGILGINIKAATDSSSLQNGYTLRYNSSTGQFEFGV